MAVSNVQIISHNRENQYILQSPKSIYLNQDNAIQCHYTNYTNASTCFWLHTGQNILPIFFKGKHIYKTVLGSCPCIRMAFSKELLNENPCIGKCWGWGWGNVLRPVSVRIQDQAKPNQ